MEHPALDLEPELLLAPDSVLDAGGAGTPPPLDLSNDDEDPDRTGELVIDDRVLEQIRSHNHPAARRIGGQCDPTRSRFASYAECPHCGGAMAAEHAHFRCGSCGWRDSCCD